MWALNVGQPQKSSNPYFICQKASASGGRRPPEAQTSYRVLHFSKIKQFQTSIIHHRFLVPCILSFISKVWFKYAPK